MEAVMLEVALPDADLRGMRQQERRLGRGHREAHRRHAAGLVAPLRDQRAPAQQTCQVLLMSGTPLFSTLTTTIQAVEALVAGANTTTPDNANVLRHSGRAGRDEERKKDKALPLVSN